MRFKIKKHRERLLTFSTAHITRADNDALDSAAISERPGTPPKHAVQKRIPGLLVRDMNDGAGWLVRVTEEKNLRLWSSIEKTGLSPQIIDIIMQANSEGYNLIWFDPDWPVDEDLKTFKW